MTTATTDKEVRWRVNFKSLEKRIEAKKNYHIRFSWLAQIYLSIQVCQQPPQVTNELTIKWQTLKKSDKNTMTSQSG